MTTAAPLTPATASPASPSRADPKGPEPELSSRNLVSAGDAVVIRAHELSKRFRMYKRPGDRLIEWLSAGRRTRHEEFWALRDVSFVVRRGECLGVMGANGSGKSTLLKILTGALRPTSGTSETRGRVLSLIELGTGINPQLTGRQNIYQSAQLLNFPPGYASEKIGEIEAFAELGEFFNRPVRTYSSGMSVRLSFAMFACFDPEIFIVDEALSVGDVFFQQRCVQRLDQMIQRGLTMLFVSHDAGKIQRLCSRAILLEHGQLTFQGTPMDVVNRYHTKLHAGTQAKAGQKPSAGGTHASNKSAVPVGEIAVTREEMIELDLSARATARHGEGGARIVAMTFHHGGGQAALSVQTHGRGIFRVLVRADRDLAEPSVGLQLYDRHGTLVYASGTRALGLVLPALAAGEEIIVKLTLTTNVAPGDYTFSVGVSEPSSVGVDGGVILDMLDGLGPLKVIHDARKARRFFGVAELPMKAEVARCED
jgi:lipopolysaccharide transport system ATP-binding protein